MNNPNNDYPLDNTGDDDGIIDDAEYLDSNDVIEVETLDETTDNVPMDDDDDDDEDVEIEDIDEEEEERITDAIDPNNNDDITDPMHPAISTTHPRPSSEELFMTITSHTGPVYTCAVVAIDTTVVTNSTTTTTTSTTATTATVAQQHSIPPPTPPTLSPPVESTSSSTSASASLLIATGGGDDIACLTRAALMNEDNTNRNYSATMASTTTSSSTTDESTMMMMMMDTDDHPGNTTTPVPPTVVTQPLLYKHSDSVSAVAFGIMTLPPTSTTTNTATNTTTTTTVTGQNKILLAVGGYDGMIVLYDGTTGDCLMNVTATNIDEYKSNFAGPTDIEWLSFHKTGTVLLAGSSTDGTVWMYHIVVPSTFTGTSTNNTNSNQQKYYYTLNCMQVFVGHASMVSAGGFTSDGRWAVTIGNSGTRDDATVRVWNPKTGMAKHTIHLHSGSTTGVLQSTNNTYNRNDDDYDDNNEDGSSSYAGLTCLALGPAEEALTTATSTPVTVPNSATSTSSATSKLIIVGSEDGWAYVCHVGTGKVLYAFRHAADPVYNNNSTDTSSPPTEVLLSIEAVGFCPSNPMWCATGGADGVLKIWDLNNGQCRHLCQYRNTDHTNQQSVPAVVGGITRLCWLPSNTTTSSLSSSSPSMMQPHPPIVFVATTDGMVHIWDARNGGLLRTLYTGGSATILDLQVLLVNNFRIVVVTASEDHLVRLFQLNIVALLQQQQARQ
jgi:ribosome assembly protein SQT1